MAENKTKMNIHDVDPPEKLMDIAQDTSVMVDSKWLNVRQQPSLVTENDRKTGVVSDTANESLRNGYKPNM